MNDIPEHHSDRIEMILSLGVSKWKNQIMTHLEGIKLPPPVVNFAPFEIDFGDPKFIQEIARAESNKSDAVVSRDSDSKIKQIFLFGRQTGKNELSMRFLHQFIEEIPIVNRAKRRGQTQPKRLPGQQYLDLKKR